MRPLPILLTVLMMQLAAVDFDRDAELTAVEALVTALPPAAELRPVDGLTSPLPQAEWQRSLAFMPGAVQFAGTVRIDKGPVDGLEVMACLQGGKVHESYSQLPMNDALLLKAACIAGLDMHDGKPAIEESAVPARGTPLAISVHWQPDPDFEPTVWIGVPLSVLVRDRLTGRAYPELPYTYTGSRVSAVDGRDSQGRPTTVNTFMLGITQSVIVNFDEPDALIASPYPTAAQDHLFEVNSAIAPAEGRQVLYVLQRTQMPLLLVGQADGSLRLNDESIDLEALPELLASRYPADGSGMRAVAIEAAAEIDDLQVLAWRRQLLQAAVAAERYVLPVFTLPAPSASAH